jgi:hypothetical protein
MTFLLFFGVRCCVSKICQGQQAGGFQFLLGSLRSQAVVCVQIPQALLKWWHDSLKEQAAVELFVTMMPLVLVIRVDCASHVLTPVACMVAADSYVDGDAVRFAQCQAGG